MKPIWVLDCEMVRGVCCLGGQGGSSSGQQKSQQGPVENPAFPALMANASRATAIADNPFQAYDPSARVAGLSGNEQTGISGVGGFLDAGKTALNNAVSGTNDVMNGDFLSGIAKYRNPFQKDVTDATLADLFHSRDMTRVSDNQNATAAHAFGGSRHGVADSLTNEAYDRTAASTLANLNSLGFDKAAGLAQGEAGTKLAAAGQQGNLANQQTSTFGQYLDRLMNSGATERGVKQQGLDAAFQEFMRRIGYPIQGQTLINQSLGLLPGGVSQAGTSSGNQNASNFGFSVFGG